MECEEIKVMRRLHAVREWRKNLDRNTKVGFVPTMGALHEGHLSLVDRSVNEMDITIGLIFVNPLQFSANEDLDTYPRQEKQDIKLLKERGCKYIFAPKENEIYPQGYCTYVETDIGKAETNDNSEGASRPTFFRGVATVLSKLFITIQPTRAYFGQKDAQQCAVVVKLVKDLCFDIQVVICDTKRDNDGLALSSRNEYLNKRERVHASGIYKALKIGKQTYEKGERQVSQLKSVVYASIEEMKQRALIDGLEMNLLYVSICERWSMKEIQQLMDEKHYLICIAAMLGSTRLIDNVVLS